MECLRVERQGKGGFVLVSSAPRMGGFGAVRTCMLGVIFQKNTPYMSAFVFPPQRGSGVLFDQFQGRAELRAHVTAP